MAAAETPAAVPTSGDAGGATAATVASDIEGSASKVSATRTGSGKSDTVRQWSDVARKISLALSVVGRFKALKETAGTAYIEPRRLTKVKVLGAGAFAQVTLCRLDDDKHGGAGPEVAVKRLKAELFHNQTDLEDFVKEGILLSSLDHPGILKVLGLGFDAADGGQEVKPESMFMVLELCAGGSVHDILRKQMMHFNKVMYTYADALRWCIQIAQGLAYLHEHEPLIIHRDLKIANVLLTGDPNAWDAKLMDFGLHATVDARDTSERSQTMKTKVAEGNAAPPKSAESMAPPPPQPFGKRATMMRKLRSIGTSKNDRALYDLTGQTGSFLNMAPEVVLGKPYDEKCDVFSMGAMFFEIFSKSIAAHDISYTGAPEEFQIYATRVARGYRRPAPAHWGPELKSLIEDCMAQEAAARPSAAEVAKRLQAIGDSGAIELMDRKSSGGCCVVS